MLRAEWNHAVLSAFLKRRIPVSAEQDLEHYILNELLNFTAHFTNLGRMEAWVKLSAREWSLTPKHAWINMDLSQCVNQLSYERADSDREL
jgi:hypothetical protein